MCFQLHILLSIKISKKQKCPPRKSNSNTLFAEIPTEAEDLVQDLQQTQACSCLANTFHLLCSSSPLPDDGCICD